MRRILPLSALAALLLSAGAGSGDVVVLKDGRTIVTAGPVVTKGRTALLKMPDGTLVSIPADQIDAAKTEASRQKATPAPTPKADESLKVLRPADIAGKKSDRKAAVVLTDDQVARAPDEEEKPAKADEGEERVEVVNAAATKGPNGYAITGSVLNSGNVDVSGVGVTIEGVSGGKTVSTVFGQLAKDQLAPGEKSTFTAEMKETAEIQTFRYAARWQSRIPVKGAAGASGTDWAGAAPPPRPEGTEGAKPEAGAEKPPEPTPVPTPKLVRIPSPDVASPPANAPIGAPDKPGGAYLPKPTGDQPKTPGGN